MLGFDECESEVDHVTNGIYEEGPNNQSPDTDAPLRAAFKGMAGGIDIAP